MGAVSCSWFTDLEAQQRGTEPGEALGLAFTPSPGGQSCQWFLPIPKFTFGMHSLPTVFISGLHVSVLNLNKYRFQCLITI